VDLAFYFGFDAGDLVIDFLLDFVFQCWVGGGGGLEFAFLFDGFDILDCFFGELLFLDFGFLLSLLGLCNGLLLDDLLGFLFFFRECFLQLVFFLEVGVEGALGGAFFNFGLVLAF
jgi:hypothetical protein